VSDAGSPGVNDGDGGGAEGTAPRVVALVRREYDRGVLARRTLRRLAGLSSTALVACASLPEARQQATFAPAPTAVLPPSFEGVAEVAFGDATMLGLYAPQRRTNDDAALFVPRTQLEGSVSLRLSRRVRLRLPYVLAPSLGALRVNPSGMPSPDEAAWGLGFGFAWRSGGFGERWNLDLVFDASVLSIPSLQRLSVRVPGEVVRAPAPQGALTLSPGYRVSRGVRPLVVVTLRNQVSNVRSFGAYDLGTSGLDPWNFYVTFGLGAELTPTCGLSVTPMLQWPLGGVLAVYGPVVSLLVHGSFGRRSEDTCRAP
jgi:hypothetical protein